MREREIKSTLIINAKQAQKVNKQTKKKEEDASDRTRKPKSQKKNLSKKAPQFDLVDIFIFSKNKYSLLRYKRKTTRAHRIPPGGEEEEEEARKIRTHRYYCSTIFFSPHSNA